MPDKPPLLRLRSLRSCLVLMLLVLASLAALFVLAGRHAPEAWRKRLVEAGAPLIVEDVREEVPAKRNAAELWAAFEARDAAGDPVFLRGREAPRELYEQAFHDGKDSRGYDEATLVDWTLSRSMEALRRGGANEADRALLRAGLALVAEDLDRLEPLLERPAWAFDEERPPWDPRTRPELFPVLLDRFKARIVVLGTRGSQLELAIEWLSVRALFAAEDGDAETAGRALLLAWHLIEALRSEPFAPEFWAKVPIELRFQATLERALPKLTATPDVVELERRLEALDIYADLADVLRTRRIEMLEWFEREPGTPTHIGDGFQRWVHWCLFGYDVQSVANAYDESIAALAGPKHAALTHFWSYYPETNGESQWLAPSMALIGGHELSFPDIIHWALRIQTQNDFLRIALADRLHGRDAALALATTLTDLAKGGPLMQAADPDGTVRLWSIGTNWKDEAGGGDDMQVVLAPPEE